MADKLQPYSKILAEKSLAKPREHTSAPIQPSLSPDIPSRTQERSQQILEPLPLQDPGTVQAASALRRSMLQGFGQNMKSVVFVIVPTALAYISLPLWPASPNIGAPNASRTSAFSISFPIENKSIFVDIDDITPSCIMNDVVYVNGVHVRNSVFAPSMKSTSIPAGSILQLNCNSAREFDRAYPIVSAEITVAIDYERIYGTQSVERKFHWRGDLDPPVWQPGVAN